MHFHKRVGTVPLTSNLTALACRVRVAREYSNMHASTRTCTRVYSREYSRTHTRVLARVHRVLEHACVHTRTRARDSRAVDTPASYPSPPLSFGVGEAWVLIDAIDTRSRVLHVLITCTHTRVTHIALACAQIFARE